MKVEEIAKEKASAKQVALQFINASDCYDKASRIEKAKSIYNMVVNDKRISISTRNKLLQELKKIIRISKNSGLTSSALVIK